MGADHHVETSHWLTHLFERRSEPSVLTRRAGIPGENCHVQEEFIHHTSQTPGARFSLHAIRQFALGDTRYGYVGNRMPNQPPPDRREISLDNIARDVDVQQVPA